MTTTAATLGAYRKDLLAQDLPEALADAITMDAAQALHRDQGTPSVPDLDRSTVETAAEAKRRDRAAQLEAAGQ